MQGDFDEAERHLQDALAQAAASGDDNELIAARRGLAMVAIERGDATLARLMVDQAKRDALRVGNVWVLGALQGYETSVLILEGRMDEARSLAEEVMPTARLAGLNAVAETSRGLAHVLRLQGDHEQAVELLDEARRIFEAEGDVGGVAHVLTELGVIHGERADHERAAGFLNEAKALRDSVGIATPGSEVGDIERTLAACVADPVRAGGR
jgi:non-specific serine/threonine protein kinase